jgi:hypothetical protein
MGDDDTLHALLNAMNIEQLRLARRTLEQIRVRALHNEFSGKPRYRDLNGCLCAVGALMPDFVLDKIADSKNNESSIGGLVFTPPGDSPYRRVRVIQVIVEETGLGRGDIKDLQQTHDNVPHSQFRESETWTADERRARANERVRKWAESRLEHLF